MRTSESRAIRLVGWAAAKLGRLPLFLQGLLLFWVLSAGAFAVATSQGVGNIPLWVSRIVLAPLIVIQLAVAALALIHLGDRLRRALRWVFRRAGR